MKLSLLVTEGVHEGKVISMQGVCLMIGRSPQCHVRPVSPEVGMRHCALLVRGDKVFVRDFDTKMGTFVNDRQLRGELEVRDGDFLQVGPLQFVLMLEYPALASAPAVAPPPQEEEQAQPPQAEDGLCVIDEEDSVMLDALGEAPAYDPAEQQRLLACKTMVMQTPEPMPIPEPPAPLEPEPVAPPVAVAPAVNGTHRQAELPRVTRSRTTKVVWGDARRRFPT